MRVDAFDFVLPPELIADRPATPRDAARLLVVGSTAPPIDKLIADLPDLLAPGDILVVNDTRVIPARLRGRRLRDKTWAAAAGGAAVEFTLHRRATADTWRAFARPARRLADGDRVAFAENVLATVAGAPSAGEVNLRFSLGGAALDAALSRIGEMPLPPYIVAKRQPDERDRADYQTVYARHDGAVAAPTAGLHFTEQLLAALAKRGVARTAVTLHVGPGTFLPVKASDTDDHRMLPEWGEVTVDAATAIADARAKGGRVVAVGTTVLRLLETAADDAGTVWPFAGETDIFIAPGYRCRAADILLTNFHLPRSTLFMLAAAFVGLARIKAAYEHAIAKAYRFYSYGDACLLHRAP